MTAYRYTAPRNRGYSPLSVTTTQGAVPFNGSYVAFGDAAPDCPPGSDLTTWNGYTCACPAGTKSVDASTRWGYACQSKTASAGIWLAVAAAAVGLGLWVMVTHGGRIR